jgi:signal transduction histidine kinase
MSALSEAPWIGRLLDAGRVLTSELDQRIVLDRVLQTAREITGARYAALGVINEQRTGLEQFVAAGLDDATRRAIGDLPRGRGVLGVLIECPQPLRLADVRQHPSSYGFPSGHPEMHSFLGVPVLIRGQVWGNLYLTEKKDGQFTARDEEAAVILAQWAAIAIENARLYEDSERRRRELEKALRGLGAMQDVAVAIGGELALEHVLELIAKRGQVLVDARSIVIMLRGREELVVSASAGQASDVHGARLPINGSTSGEVLEEGRSRRVSDVAARLRIAPSNFGVADAQTALLVPMVYRDAALGVLAAFDHGEQASTFSEDDEEILRTFAASAATAVALAESVQADRLRSALAAADAERRRWARELHDETLQGLGGLRLLLSSALLRDQPELANGAMREAIEYIEREIANLRALITELRPAALDELGLKAAIESLLERHQQQSGCRVESELRLPDPDAGQERLDEELETAAYRLVQEALSNVAKHARASAVRLVVCETDGELLIEVRDDGGGFDINAPGEGFGLTGMRERVSLAGGSFTITSGAHGTLLRATLPARQRAGAIATSRPQQAAS